MSVGWEKQPRSEASGRWMVRPGSVKRCTEVKIRLTRKEGAALKALAAASGLTVTAYVVECCITRQAPAKPSDGLKEAMEIHQRRLYEREHKRHGG